MIVLKKHQINDIETFLIAITYCIKNNKEDILSKCKDNDKIINLDNLKFKKKIIIKVKIVFY